MSAITKETRKESYDIVCETIGARQILCLETLIELGGEATSNEIAMRMFQKGLVPFYNTNFCSPRLHELAKLDKVEVIGKKVDKISNRKVAIYKIKES